MAKVIKLKNLKNGKGKTQPEPVATPPSRLLFIRAKGDPIIVNHKQPELWKFLKDNEKKIARNYRMYREINDAIQMKEGETVEAFQQRLPTFPAYALSEELYEAIMKETACKFDIIWICLTSPGFPVALLYKEGASAGTGDINEIIKAAYLESDKTK